MAGLRTEFPFTLPKGYIASDGVLHRHGTMRLATARDEIEPLRDRSIDGPDDPYLTILVLARVISELGSLPTVDTNVVEGLFAADLAFLQDLYGIINFGDQNDVAALQESVLPVEVDDQPDIDGRDFDGVTEPDVTDSDVTEPDVIERDEQSAPERNAGSDDGVNLRAARSRGRIEEVTPTGHG